MLKLFFYTLLVFLQTPVIQEINKEEVHDLIEKSSINIIDLRTNKEFSQGSIKDSYNIDFQKREFIDNLNACLLYTSPSPRDLSTSRMPSSA